MKKNRFEISRYDGRSDGEVLEQVIAGATPGEIIEYDVLAKSLEAGTDKEYTVARVQSAIARAERRLASKLNRALVNVRGEGYKIALACEHQLIAGRKKARAGNLLKRGLTVLQNVDWSEMTETQRQAHQGQLMVVGALHAAMEGIDRRLSKVESALDRRNMGD